MSEERKGMVEGIKAGNIERPADELFASREERWVKLLFAEFNSTFSDWREEIVEMVAEDDKVAGRFRCSGMHRVEFPSEAPTGKRTDVEEVFFLRVKDGNFWALDDGLNRLPQLGLTR